MTSQNTAKSWQDIHKGAYSGVSAVDDFYSSRRTDGGRPVTYSRLLYSDIRTVKNIVSIGCGKADAEKIILTRTALDRSSIQFIGYDFAQSMLDAAEREFAGSPWRYRFESQDVFCDAFIDKAGRNALQSKTLFLAIGRTIGNLPLYDGLLKLLSLAQTGVLWFDCYGGPKSGEEAFRRRMVEISSLSLDFWKSSAYLNYGIDIQSVNIDFDEFECGLAAIFRDSQTNVPIFSIRYLHQDKLVIFIKNKAAALRPLVHKISGQFAPMIAVRVEPS